MQTLIIIGLQKSGSSRDAVQAAENLGYYTVVFTDKITHFSQREEFPDVHEMILVDFNNMKMMEEKIKLLQEQGKEIEAIMSLVDPYVYTAAILCEKYCNRTISKEAIFIMENKIQTRLFLKDTEYSIKYGVLDKGKEVSSFLSNNKLEYPLIMKIPHSSGSKDVIKAENYDEVKRHVEMFKEEYSDTPILFEEYIEGPQYLIEVFVQNNEINIVAIIEQEISLQNRFIITGYSLLADVSNELYDSLFKVVRSIIDKLQYTNGSCHFELRRKDDQWKVIEINPRISGGAMNKMIESAYGINYVEQIIKLLVGDKPDLTRNFSRFVFTQYITIGKKGRLQYVTGKKRALEIEGVVDVYVKPRKGAFLRPPLSMGHRYAYVIAAAMTIEEAKSIAKEAAKEIKFQLYNRRFNNRR